MKTFFRKVFHINRESCFDFKAPQVEVSFLTTFCPFQGNMFAPNPDITSDILRADGLKIGYVKYAVSPLFNCVFLNHIQIDQLYRRKGYGSAAIRNLARLHGLPVTPVGVTDTARAFYGKARGCQSLLTVDLDQAELVEECKKWKDPFPQVVR